MVLSDLEGVAAFFAVERPDLLGRSVEAQAAVLGVGVGDLKALWRSGEFRGLVDEFTAVRVFNPEVRVRQYEVLRDISLEGERDADRLKAFDVSSRQLRVKVPERHEVDDRKSIEVSVRHLPRDEGGFVPEVPFNGPSGRRAALGERVERRAVERVAGGLAGPFDVGGVAVEVAGGSVGEEEL